MGFGSRGESESMSRLTIHINESTGERFRAAVRAAYARGNIVSVELERRLKPLYVNWGTRLGGFLDYGGFGTVVVDTDDEAEDAPLSV